MDTVAAAGTIERRNLNIVLVLGKLFPDGVFPLQRAGLVDDIGVTGQVGADGSMWADKRALITLDAAFWDPDRDIGGDAPFLILGSAEWEDPVITKLTYGQIVALEQVHRTHNLGNKAWLTTAGRGALSLSILPFGRIIDFDQRGYGTVHSGIVLRHHFFAFAFVGFLDGVFDKGNGLGAGDHISDLKEGRLHNGIDTSPLPYFMGYSYSIDVVKDNLLAGNRSFQSSRELMLHFI